MPPYFVPSHVSKEGWGHPSAPLPVTLIIRHPEHIAVPASRPDQRHQFHHLEISDPQILVIFFIFLPFNFFFSFFLFFPGKFPPGVPHKNRNVFLAFPENYLCNLISDTFRAGTRKKRTDGFCASAFSASPFRISCRRKKFCDLPSDFPIIFPYPTCCQPPLPCRTEYCNH